MAHDLKIDRALLQHLAELARLNLSADREGVLRQQLQRLVDAFSALGGDPGATAATDQPGASAPSLTLRPDVSEPPMPIEQVLANAPRTADDSFVVPRVVDA